ncbi:glycine zipper family protein [Curvibacter sp. APW13]|uniref:glycine zipper family protein n=1 Tax=Curvibacter sp. APW13 TaxID=3077236 RepID=UPI0028E0413A|nr:glycine zipper family protein [Curvibacter sp. APW13]MDT8991914.1 glycine zipper family protein [Curvibacter sp. APW13]
MTSTSTRILCSALLTASLLGGCASTGPSSPSARPVFYPNAKLNAVGQERANQDADVCMGQARNAGLTPDEKDNAVLHGAEKGAAIGGVAGAVGALVRGKGVERAVEHGAVGAAVGGSAGAVAGAFHEKPSGTYRHYVQRCLKDKGYDVIGWN